MNQSNQSYLLPTSRRDMLRTCGVGFGALALGDLMTRHATAGETASTLAMERCRFTFPPRPSTSSTCS